MPTTKVWQLVVYVLWQIWDHQKLMFYPLFSHFKNLRKILGQRAILQTNLFWGQLLRCSMVQKFTLKNYGISLLAVLLLKVVGNSVKDFFEVCFLKLWNLQWFGFLVMKTVVQSMADKLRQSFLPQLNQEECGYFWRLRGARLAGIKCLSGNCS